MDNMNFCPACGKELPVGTAYCPACGSRLNDPEGERKEKAALDNEALGRIKIAAILLVVNAFIMLFFAIVYITSTGLIEEMFNAYPLIADYYTPESLQSLMRTMGIVLLIAAAISVVAALMAYKRRLWGVVFVLCIVSMLLGILTLFGTIIGVLVLYLIAKAKPAFTD